MTNNHYDFSVIIPSRNRPDMLRCAVESVLTQTHSNTEVIVVNDGSRGDAQQTYQTMAAEWAGRVQFHHLPATPNGHGPNFARNRGVECASGLYIAFLDDDDWWIDHDYLRRFYFHSITSPTDVCFAHQIAYYSNQVVSEQLWLGKLAYALQRTQSSLDPDQFYPIDVAMLMATCGGSFAHLNTTIVRRDLYLSIGGMDESLRYEGDWDFYLRLIDTANTMYYFPRVTSRHNVPDQTQNANVSTAVSDLRKLLFRSHLLDKAILFCQHAAIVDMAQQHKMYTVQRIAALLERADRVPTANFYKRQTYLRYLNSAFWRQFVRHRLTRNRHY